MSFSFRRGVAFCVAVTALTARVAFGQGSPISQGNWTLHDVDSQETEAPVTPPPTRSTATRTACGPPDGRRPRRRRRMTFRLIWARCMPSAASGICRGRTGPAGPYRAIRVLRQHGWRDLGHGGRIGDVPEHGSRERGVVHGEVGTVRPPARAHGSPRSAVDDRCRAECAGGGRVPPPISPGTGRCTGSTARNGCRHNAATNAFDGNPNSMWATRWSTAPRRRRRMRFRSIWARCMPSAASGICRGRTGPRTGASRNTSSTSAWMA